MDAALHEGSFHRFLSGTAALRMKFRSHARKEHRVVFSILAGRGRGMLAPGRNLIN